MASSLSRCASIPERQQEMTTYDIERAILSSVMQSDVYDLDMAGVEIEPDIFADMFHKNVAKVITAMRAKSVPVTEELVAHYLGKNGLLDPERFFHILSVTPYASVVIVMALARVLKKENAAAQWMAV